MKRILLLLICITTGVISALSQSWPTVLPEARPGVRWWWLGSAVDKKDLKWSLDQYHKAGIGAVEITPIYGVQGNDKNDIPYLSPKWMEMLRFVEDTGKADSIEIDMNNGTGWPFGGPWVPINEAACKAVFCDTVVNANANLMTINYQIPEKERKYAKPQIIKSFPIPGDKKHKRVIVLYISRTGQKVKRAAPGGEGYVMDHFDKTAVAHYLAHFDSAFTATHTPFPHTMFNDSYEVYNADWTPSLLKEFQARRGYKLQDKFPEFLAGDPQVVSDYRETLSELLLENFTEQWTAWAHRHGAITRNQAHGSPANLIDCYAAVDIPEIEGFGLTDFGIKGLRRDSIKTRPNYSDLSMLKYAPSAAHITGKPFTSSETFTWLTEHFRTSLSQLKPDLDLMFCAGVNHMFFHGTAYSPKDDPWPGWKFYASIDMSPTNSIWRDAPFLMQYITRCQSFLQWGKPDNDFLVYLPIYNMWRRDTHHRLMQFSIESMAQRAPKFIKDILNIVHLGYDCDYISDRYLMGCTIAPDGSIQTAAGTRYKGIIIPEGAILKPQIAEKLKTLAKDDPTRIMYGVHAKEMSLHASPEIMKADYGLKMIRRSNPSGYHYFIANLTPNDMDAFVPLAVHFKSATWFNPLNGNRYAAEIRKGKVHILLRSGESRILLTSDKVTTGTLPAEGPEEKAHLADIDLTHQKWQLSFIDEAPKVGETFQLDGLKTWENLDGKTRVTMGTGVYQTTFKLNRKQASAHWNINLGDVRESARVYLNGQFIGCAWSVPFILNCKNALKKGKNTLRIEVTNLPANRIADLDRKGVKWRKFKEINFVDITYHQSSYAHWGPVPSGLNSTVRLQQATKQTGL
ncbi:MAG: glycosyl hydrolase family 2 [Prevotella sp.]|nr:glycosyl hydrolase family 2 [Prevotella sp.]